MGKSSGWKFREVSLFLFLGQLKSRIQVWNSLIYYTNLIQFYLVVYASPVGILHSLYSSLHRFRQILKTIHIEP